MDDKKKELEELREEIVKTSIGMACTMTKLKKMMLESGMDFSAEDEKEYNELLKEANDLVDTLDSIKES